MTLLAFIAAYLVICSCSNLLIARGSRIPSFLLLLGGLMLCGLGLGSWAHSINLEFVRYLALGGFPILLRCDTLTCFFVLLMGLVCMGCGIYSSDYIGHAGSRINSRLYWCLLFSFVLGMYVLVIAGNAITFLAAWELMSLSSFVLVASEYQKLKAQKAAFIYLVATRLATMLLTAGFLLMFNASHSLVFTEWSFNDRSNHLAAVLILIGLIVKAGIWPFHLWLPYAHAEAPAPVSSLMSGIMVKLPIYATLRFFVYGHLHCAWLSYVLLILATITAFWGVLFALNQRDLKRVLAYSTVENVGLTYMGVALCLIAQCAGLVTVGQMALLAVLLHVAFHAIFKSLLFLCAGSVDFACDTRDMAKLGGIGKTMPFTFSSFLLGSAAICALPPFNGFVSKWCIYQALLECTYQLPTVMGRGLCLALIGVLGTVGALAVACFVKAIGVTFLGRPRSTKISNVHEVPWSMVAPQLLLAVACLVSGLSAPGLLASLEQISVAAGFGHIGSRILQAIDLGPLSLTTILIMALAYFAIARARPNLVRTWDCGFGAVPINSQVSAESFAQPIARIFSPVLQHHVVVDITGQDRRHFPEKIHVEPSMVSLLETRVYAPIGWFFQALSQILARLQAGSIHLYLLYVCIGLVLLLAVGAWF